MDGEISARIVELRLKARPAAWRDAGFEVEGDRCRLGSVAVRLDPSAEHGWTLHGPPSADFDGLPTALSDGLPVLDSAAPEHPNSTLQIDHIVVFTPGLERTIGAFEGNGVRCRRVREVGPPDQQLRQGFFRFGEVICEVVEVPEDQAGPDGIARFWGLTVTVADLDGAVADLGELCGTIRDAVQPGRRIATIRKQAGLGLPVALISPEP